MAAAYAASRERSRYGKPPTPQDNSLLILLGFALIGLAVIIGVLVILEG